jgi:LIVCS family branched-chain amino acid:cation transporter
MNLQNQTKESNALLTGLALFSMFFGAGNLIFPILMGQNMGENIGFALLGLCITAVIIPLMGLIVMILFKGDIKEFLGRMGKTPGLLVLLLLQLILGPLGVIPRLITLMHASIRPYFGSLSLLTFSLISCFIIFLMTFKRQKLIGILGKYLTPILLLSLGALIAFGFIQEPSWNMAIISKGDSFLQGLITGYNTMDLIAAFLFSSLVIPHFQINKTTQNIDKKNWPLFKKMLLSSLIAAFLLVITYLGLCLISARHAGSFDETIKAEDILSAIAIKLLGPLGGLIASLTVMTACLTTAITLTSIFSDYLQRDIFKQKISSKASLIITLFIAAIFSNFGFDGIASFLSPLLQIIYPALILLTFLNLMHALYGFKNLKTALILLFLASTIFYFLPFS